MYKIAVIGDRESVLGFKALGLDVFFAEDAEDARETISRISKENYAVIYITESLASPLASEIARFKDSPVPAVILIPGKEGSLGLGLTAVHKAVERAVGADILSDERK
ncbi:MAG: V-type ATP synthase subunit F [Bacillota bacterium]|nr:V-type ATP synthase subunit F [Bacillota bacterium]